MAYYTGERLKFTGISGNYSTVITDIPTGDKTITFDFVECTDGDNNNYPVVKIGTQVWMAENLKTTRYRDGSTSIPLKTDDTQWNTSTPGYCWYNNQEATYKATYGALYNWYTVSTGNLCPTGWHVPTDAEWTILTDYLGGISTAGDKLKENGTTHWISPNSGATNETGFTALPGGLRQTWGPFDGIGGSTYFWSSSENPNPGDAWYRRLRINFSGIDRDWLSRKYGYSVRCITGAELPTLFTTVPSLITQISALCGGNIISDGGALITSRGVCWSTSSNPTIADSKTTDGSGTGIFSSSITGLTTGTTYYSRAYAVNSVGIAYGNEINFTTGYPVLTTLAASSITQTTASSGGNITSDGGAIVTARGVCWGTLSNPTIEDNHTQDGTGIGSFNSTITGLTLNTKYYVRAYATNSTGIVYGNEISFNTNSIAILTTDAASSLTQTTAICGGNITSDGGALITDRGVCWSISSNPTVADSKTTDGSGTGTFSSSITGLTTGTTYNARAYAINSVGIAYGNEIYFTTGQVTLTSINASSITQTTATSGGHITSNGGTIITDRGVCWSTLTNPTIEDNHSSDGTGIGIFNISITGLTPNTKYYIRAFATNSEGTTYGNEIFFATKGETGTVSDIDGNTYLTIVIGTQTWMAENLKTTKYSNSDLIGTTTPTTLDISGETAPKYQWAYDGNDSNVATYGRLYTWHSVTDNRNICPTGWYVPSTSDWHTLVLYLDPNAGLSWLESYLAGGKLKETGLIHWLSPNTEATNETGFTVLPGGYRAYDGPFGSKGWNGYLWSSSELNTNDAWYELLTTYNGRISRFDLGKANGFSVRCLKESTSYVATTIVTTFNTNSAIVGGIIVYDGHELVTQRGVYWGVSQNPETTGTKLQIGGGTGSFSTNLSGLNPNTTYYIKAYATNSLGTSYGNELSFTTDPLTAPELTTLAAASITQTSASSGGNVIVDGGLIVSSRGVCWSTSENPTFTDFHTSDGTGAGIFISNLTGLILNTKYYLRAYATNSIGTSYGNEIFFATRGETGTISDSDGNTYSTIVIGSQTWMTENLKTTKYKDGSTAIPNITDNTVWSNLITPGYCWYNNSESTYKNNYGALYNGYAVSTENLCPTGWHVPSNIEWTTLTDYLGGESVAGDKLKEAGTIHWINDNVTATNETGFLSLPGGERDLNGEFSSNGSEGIWWGSTKYDADNLWYRGMYYNESGVGGGYDPEKRGLSVRCLKD
jgi:uncharacterized protein (TIGR02145 family)